MGWDRDAEIAGATEGWFNPDFQALKRRFLFVPLASCQQQWFVAENTGICWYTWEYIANIAFCLLLLLVVLYELPSGLRQQCSKSWLLNSMGGLYEPLLKGL